MTKPEISPTKLLEYEKVAETLMNSPEAQKIPEAFRKSLREVCIAGEWFESQLKDNGADEDQIYKLGFVFGQRCLGRDPWSVAQEQLRKFLTGEAEEPGEVLAEEIIAEQFAGTELGDYVKNKIKGR